MDNMYHYCDVMMGAMASQITNLTIVYSIVHSGADKKTQRPVTWSFDVFFDLRLNERLS